MAKEQTSEGGAPEWMVSYADMLTIMLAFFVVLYATTGTTSDGKDKGEKAGKGAAASKNPTGAHDGAGPREGPGGKEGIGPREGGGATAGKDGGAKLKDAQQAQLDKVFESLYHRFGPDWTVSNCWIGGPPELRDVKLVPMKRDGGSDAAKGRRGLSGNDPCRARGTRSGDNSLVGGLFGATVLLSMNWLLVRTLYRYRQLDKLEGAPDVLISNGRLRRSHLDRVARELLARHVLPADRRHPRRRPRALASQRRRGLDAGAPAVRDVQLRRNQLHRQNHARVGVAGVLQDVQQLGLRVALASERER